MQLNVARWAVLLRSSGGFHIEFVEADAGGFTDDGKNLEFYNFEKLVDAVKVAEEIQSATSLPPDQAEAAVRKLFSLLGGFRVASFARADVAGYNRGDAPRLDVPELTDSGTQPPG